MARLRKGIKMGDDEELFEIGQPVVWRKVVSNYGDEEDVPAIVQRLGALVTILVERKDGVRVKRTVTRARLRARGER